jgi:hypothetical protein
MDQPPKLLDRLPSLPPRPSSKTNIPAQGPQGAQAQKSKEAKEAAAKKRLTARLEAMDAAALEPPAVDPRTASVAALMVANFIGDDAVRARFAPLAGAKLFDLNAIDDLPVAARFVLRILPKLGPELDQRDSVPRPSLLAQVKATRGEMLRIAERHLGDTDEAHGRIVTIRMGEGSADDVHDLRMLADLWSDYGEALAKGVGATFRPEADKEARELATHLELALLGPLSQEDEEWRSYLHRALAMLVPLYDEVCRAGRFLFHHEKPEARFPTLASVARVRRRLRREAARQGERGASIPAPSRPTPFPSAPISIPPEISLVEVSTEDEEALAAAMVSVPPVSSGPPSTPAPATSPSPMSPAGGYPSGRSPVLPSAPSAQRSVPSPAPATTAPPNGGAAKIDPIEVVRLDFSPTASPGEDADANLETADLDLELTYVSESNFYSDVIGQEIGLFVATFVVKAPGTPIAIRLSLPQLDHPILVSGFVHWVREFSPSIEAPPGMGVALNPPASAHRRAMETFMKLRPPILHDD